MALHEIDREFLKQVGAEFAPCHLAFPLPQQHGIPIAAFLFSCGLQEEIGVVILNRLPEPGPKQRVDLVAIDAHWCDERLLKTMPLQSVRLIIEIVHLPFARDALDPVMSGETLDYHHGKHHKAYVDKVNGFLAEGKGDEANLVEVVRRAHQNGDKKMFNNAAQIWNHSFFWQCLAPADGQRPTGKLQQLIEEGFGGTDALLAKLKDESVNHFSNGWSWLVLNRDKLEVTSLHDADTPLVYDGMVPLLTLDLWEHAYYIDYRNERPRYAETVLGKIINWDFVAQNLDGQGAGRADQDPSGVTREVETA